MFKFIWKKKFWFLAVVIVAAVIISRIFPSGEGDGNYEFAEAAYIDIVQEVSVTGTVESDSKIDLRFQRSGKISAVPYEVGDFVSSGAMLAGLDTTSLSISVQSAQADLALAQANYDQALAGSTEEAVWVAQAAYEKAQADLAQVRKTLENTEILSAESISAAELDYNTALNSYNNAKATYGEDVVHAYEDAYNVLDEVFNEIVDSLRDVDNILGVDNEDVNDSFELAFEATNNYDYVAAQGLYSAVEDENDSLSSDFSGIEASDYDELGSLLEEAVSLLDDMDRLLDDTDDLLVNVDLVGGFTETLR
ncbi:MAG: hypothetical protein ACD_65C00230G0007, partial [uncultured bacterium]